MKTCVVILAVITLSNTAHIHNYSDFDVPGEEDVEYSDDKMSDLYKLLSEQYKKEFAEGSWLPDYYDHEFAKEEKSYGKEGEVESGREALQKSTESDKNSFDKQEEKVLETTTEKEKDKIAIANEEEEKKVIYDLADAPQLFEKFIKDYERKYKDDAEYQRRYKAFVETLKEINRVNMSGASYSTDINLFADYDKEEFSSLSLGSLIG